VSYPKWEPKEEAVFVIELRMYHKCIGDKPVLVADNDVFGASKYSTPLSRNPRETFEQVECDDKLEILEIYLSWDSSVCVSSPLT
jgi:hypothetical protein